MEYIIRTQYRERINSVSLNKKIDILVGGNRVLDGFIVSFEKGNLNLTNGKCVIEGACIESAFKRTKVIQIPSSFRLHSELWLSLQYNHEKTTIKEIISDKEPSPNYALTLCRLKRIGDGYSITLLNRMSDLARISDMANEAYKGQVELQKIYDNQIKNMTNTNPSNMEVVDARGTFPKLKARLDNMELAVVEEVDQVREVLDENATRLDKLENVTPVWQEYKAVRDIAINDSFDGVTKDLTIKGKTLKNLLSNKNIEFDAVNNRLAIRNSENSSLFANKTYALYNLSDKPIRYTIDRVSNNSYIKGANVNANTISIVNLARDEYISIIFGAIKDGWENSENSKNQLKQSCVILEGNYNCNPFNTYFEGIVSAGELEDNKIKLKSVGKNLFNPTGESEENTIYYADTGIKSINNDYKTFEFTLNNRCYSISGTTNKAVHISFFNNHRFVSGLYLGNLNNRNFNVPHCNIVKISIPNNAENIILNEGTIATEYEQYKSCKQEVTIPFDGGLKGLSNGVSDEAKNSNIIQRIEKTVLDASESISTEPGDKVPSDCLKFVINKENLKAFNPLGDIISSKFIKGTDAVKNSIRLASNNLIVIIIEKSRLSTEDVAGFKKWLQQNPITLVYELMVPIVHEIEPLKLKTYDKATYVFQKNNIQGEKSLSVLISLKKSLSRLEEENKELKEEKIKLNNLISMQSEYFHGQDLNLASSNLDLDFRLMEIEFALDIEPMVLRGGREMAVRTPYEMMKILIIGGRYEREDLEYKMSVYLKRGRMSQEEADELVALMDARELEDK